MLDCVGFTRLQIDLPAHGNLGWGEPLSAILHTILEGRNIRQRFRPMRAVHVSQRGNTDDEIRTFEGVRNRFTPRMSATLHRCCYASPTCLFGPSNKCPAEYVL